MAESSRSLAGGRRATLASIAAGAVALGSGCARRLRTVTGWEPSSQVSLRIKAVPADADPYALRAARTVAGWFRAAGIDAGVTPVAREELLRQVLLNAEFDLFVARLPERFRSPDGLYSLLHSRFGEAPGWQNPFGYADLDVDEMLETQRRASDGRRQVVARVQRTVAETQPFTVLAFPDDIRTARTDRYRSWLVADLASPLGYLTVERAGADPSDRRDGSTPEARADEVLRLAVTDRRATENLNPLAAEFRGHGVLTGLLYDPLGYDTGTGTVEPWLAESWAFPEERGETRARVRLREDLVWHDGEPLTASDVAFTHALLADTSLGADRQEGEAGTEAGTEDPVPAPRFQGRNSLVADVRVLDETTVEFRFVECDPGVATRAFTVPVLPEHVWADRTGPASVGGIVVGGATEALVTSNIPPVGSGPLRFVRNTPRESLVLERFDGHFLDDDPSGGLPGRMAGGPAFDRLSVRVVGSDVTAVEMVADGDADVTGTAVGAATVPRIGRADDLDLLVDRSETPYLLGYNARRPPLTNPRFRNTLARLIDGSYLAGTVFEGYAQPAVSPLAGTDWLPSDLRWDGTNPVTPFIGSDGELDVRRARDAFRDAGYQYDEGALVEVN